MRRWVRDWGPALAWAALIVFLSSRTSLPVSLEGGRDKVAHFGVYFVLGFFLARGGHRTGWHVVWPILLGFAFGAFDEMFQGLIPNRTPAVSDWIADALGVLVGTATFHTWRRRSAGSAKRQAAAHSSPNDR